MISKNKVDILIFGMAISSSFTGTESSFCHVDAADGGGCCYDAVTPYIKIKEDQPEAFFLLIRIGEAIENYIDKDGEIKEGQSEDSFKKEIAFCLLKGCENYNSVVIEKEGPKVKKIYIQEGDS